MCFEAKRAFWVLLPQKADPLFLYTLRPLGQTDRPRFWLSLNPRWVNPIFHFQLPVSHRRLDNIIYVIAVYNKTKLEQLRLRPFYYVSMKNVLL